MAEPAAVARAVVGVADVVGLASITTRDSQEGREPGTGPGASVAAAGRNRNDSESGGEGFRGIDGGNTSELERTGSQPAGGVAGNAIPSRNRFGV